MRFLMICMALLAVSVANADDVHRVVLHIADADPGRQHLVLNNASNVNQYYLDKGEEAEIEIVAYGPGLTMLIPGQSPVAPRIDMISQNYENIGFRACANTHRKMSQKAGHEIPLMPQAEMVPSGVIHLVERQEQGWSYIRP